MPELPPTGADRTDAGSVAPAYFERLYAEREDPWAFATSGYEAAKYRATLDALPRERYGSALEVGCAEGVLTARLAERCGHVLAVDVSDDALDRARRRCRSLDHVAFENRVLPADLPPGPFDLVLLSEVGYYWSRDELAAALGGFALALAPGGHLALVHWTGATDYPLTGDAVHQLAVAAPGWRSVYAERHDRFVVDVLERGAPA